MECGLHCDNLLTQPQNTTHSTLHRRTLKQVDFYAGEVKKKMRKICSQFTSFSMIPAFSQSSSLHRSPSASVTPLQITFSTRVEKQWRCFHPTKCQTEMKMKLQIVDKSCISLSILWIWQNCIRAEPVRNVMRNSLSVLSLFNPTKLGQSVN